MKNINLMAPINQLGYGIAGLNIYKELSKIANVSLFPIGQPQITTQQDADAIQKGLEVAQFFDPKAPCIKIWHQNQMADFVGGGQHIGFPIFELDTFTDLEKHHLQACDRLFVCSEWAKNVCYDINLTDVVPLGVDADIFKPVAPSEEDKTIFFNCGKWEVRKGHDVLIEAFSEVAKKHDNVELWMMCTNPFNTPDEENKWRNLYSHPNVRLINRVETQEEVYNIMSKVDCGVFPSRGEGWNLEALELMSCGKHVIITDYSAHTEFCTKDNSNLVTITDTEPAFDGKWFFGQGNWAKISEDQVSELQGYMESFHTSKKILNESGIDTAKKFSWRNTATKIIDLI